MRALSIPNDKGMKGDFKLLAQLGLKPGDVHLENEMRILSLRLFSFVFVEKIDVGTPNKLMLVCILKKVKTNESRKKSLH